MNRIVDLYGRMVAAGLWKDYAIELRARRRRFLGVPPHRRAARISDREAPRRAARGLWALIGEAGQVLRRGHELGPILAPIERRLLKVVAG